MRNGIEKREEGEAGRLVVVVGAGGGIICLQYINKTYHSYTDIVFI